MAANNLYVKVQKMSKIGYVLFSETSVIAFNLDKNYVKQASKDLKKKLKAEKISVFKRAEAQNMFWEEFGEQFLTKTAQEITAEYKDAVEIEYGDIRKFKWTPFRENVRSRADETTQDYLGEISVKTDSKKIWYNHRYKAQDSKYLSVEKIKDSLPL